MNTTVKSKILLRPSLHTGGYTLIELMVASLIVVISIIAIIAMVRKGQELSSDDGHRRMARSLITTLLESATYTYTNYGNLTAQTVTDTVVIDTRGSTSASDDLMGVRTVTVGAEATVTGTGSISVPYKPLTFKVVWTEPEGPDSVKIQKQITQAD